MKKVLMILFFMVSFGFSNECKIITSPLDLNNMSFGYSSWQGQTQPIVNGETFKYTGFLTAYQDFDKYVNKQIQDIVCKKNGWNGVVNYKIQWQQTDKMYNFIATYDTFSYK